MGHLGVDFHDEARAQRRVVGESMYSPLKNEIGLRRVKSSFEALKQLLFLYCHFLSRTNFTEKNLLEAKPNCF